MVEVVNRQRRLKVDTETWATFAEKASEAIGNATRRRQWHSFPTKKFDNLIASFAAS